MRSRRNPWLLVVLLMAGALIGGICGELLSGYRYFGWMSFGGVNGYRELFSFSLSPAVDLRVLRLGFDLSLKINAGSIIGMLLGFLVFLKL